MPEESKETFDTCQIPLQGKGKGINSEPKSAKLFLHQPSNRILKVSSAHIMFLWGSNNRGTALLRPLLPTLSSLLGKNNPKTQQKPTLAHKKPRQGLRGGATAASQPNTPFPFSAETNGTRKLGKPNRVNWKQQGRTPALRCRADLALLRHREPLALLTRGIHPWSRPRALLRLLPPGSGTIGAHGCVRARRA